MRNISPTPCIKKKIIFALWLHVSKCTFWFTFSQHVSSKNKLHKITARILKMHNNNLCLIKNFQTILNYHCLPYITGPKFTMPFFIFPFPTIYCHLTIILDRCVSALKKSFLQTSKCKLEGPQKVGGQTVRHCATVQHWEPLCCVPKDIKKKPKMSVF